MLNTDSSPKLIESFWNVDCQNQIVFIAELVLSYAGDLKMIIGVTRLIQTTENRAEFVVVVAVELEGQGVGSKAMQMLIEFAKDRKLSSIYGAGHR